jgi:hypothetical protein
VPCYVVDGVLRSEVLPLRNNSPLDVTSSAYVHFYGNGTGIKCFGKAEVLLLRGPGGWARGSKRKKGVDYNRRAIYISLPVIHWLDIP